MIKSQYAFGTKAKDPIVNVIPAAARIIMSFRPFRSARFPQIGATTADAKAVTEIASPKTIPFDLLVFLVAQHKLV